MHILITDDNRSNRDEIRLCVAQLEKKNLHADMAVNAADARDKIKTHSYDYIFINYDLPDMDGISLLKSLTHAKTKLPPCPVIMMIEPGREGVMMDAFEYGAQDFLVRGNITADTVALTLHRGSSIFEMKMVYNTVEELLGDLNPKHDSTSDKYAIEHNQVRSAD